MGVNRKFRII